MVQGTWKWIMLSLGLIAVAIYKPGQYFWGLVLAYLGKDWVASPCNNGTTLLYGRVALCYESWMDAGFYEVTCMFLVMLQRVRGGPSFVPPTIRHKLFLWTPAACSIFVFIVIIGILILCTPKINFVIF